MRRAERRLGFLALVALTACGGSSPSAPASAPSSSAAHEPDSIALVESAPLETALDHASIPNASDVWPEMIATAKNTLDFAEYYASEAEGESLRSSRLAPVIAATCGAVKRGVRVRFLVDSTMAPKYPATLATLRACGVEVRELNQVARKGGVLHAKYFVIDEEACFLGSQNFDWRSLAHIQEMGVRIRSRAIARALEDVFAIDWKFAGGESRARPSVPRTALDVTLPEGERVSLLASPDDELPDPAIAELPRLIALVDAAKSHVSIQSLTYSKKLQHGPHKGDAFTALDDALVRAAARGVKVELLVSHWALQNEDDRAALGALSAVANASVRVITIPPSSSGEIPYARVAHSKYLIADDRAAWIGTGNWEGDYFVQSRDVSVIVQSARIAKELRAVFDDAWASTLSAPFAP